MSGVWDGSVKINFAAHQHVECVSLVAFVANQFVLGISDHSEFICNERYAVIKIAPLKLLYVARPRRALTTHRWSELNPQVAVLVIVDLAADCGISQRTRRICPLLPPGDQHHNA